MTVTEINERIELLIDKLNSTDKKVRWSIQYSHEGDHSPLRTFAEGFDDGPVAAASVQEKLQMAMKDSSVDYIRVNMGNNRIPVKDYFEFELKARPGYSIARAQNDIMIQSGDNQNTRNAKAAYQQVSGQSPFGNVPALLGLLGFDMGGLNGVENDPLGGLGAILSVRDNNIRQQYEAKEQNRLLDMAHQDADKLRSENESLKKDIASKDRKIEKLTILVEDYEDEIRKLDPNHTIAGRSLIGILSGVGQSLLRRNAGLIGQFMGADRDSVLGMIDDQSQPSPAASSADVDVDIEPEDGRSESIQKINSWSRTLSDDEYEKYLAILNAFMQNKQVMINLFESWVKASHQQVSPNA